MATGLAVVRAIGYGSLGKCVCVLHMRLDLFVKVDLRIVSLLFEHGAVLSRLEVLVVES